MNYVRVYAEFIADRRSKEPTKGGERHHIVPRCIRRDERPENIIQLTFADHLFAHLLLAKIYGSKTIQAAKLMLNRVGVSRGKLARRRYGWITAKHAQVMREAQTIRMRDPDLRHRTSIAMQGRPKSVEAIAKRTATRRLKPPYYSPETRAAMAERNRTPNPVKIAAMRAANMGRIKPKSEITKISNGMKIVWQKRKAGLLPMPKAA